MFTLLQGKKNLEIFNVTWKSGRKPKTIKDNVSNMLGRKNWGAKNLKKKELQ